MWLNNYTIKVNEPLTKALLTKALQEKTNMTSADILASCFYKFH